jgi:hypothetical protein
MGYRSCLGLMRLFEKQKEKEDAMSEEQLDAISGYALEHQKFRLKQIKELLKSSPKNADEESGLFALANHTNIRGSGYYDQ